MSKTTAPPVRTRDGSAPATGTTSSPRTLADPRDAFVELGRIVLGQQPLSEVLQRVAELARSCVPGAEEISVTLLEGSTARSAAFTGRLAATLDERQYETGFGPCLDAAQSGHTVRIDDTADEPVYPGFAATARRQGVCSVVSVGMPATQRVLGGLNVYRFDGGALDAEAVEVLQTFASYASVCLANAALLDATAARAGQLQLAMRSRAVIDQAQGVLIAQLRCTPEEAFQHLAKLSQNTNRKLRDLAADVVEQAARG
ncbi:GAF and ANTAR domain-containing protein [Kineococcus sp. NUM-3379]